MRDIALFARKTAARGTFVANHCGVTRNEASGHRDLPVCLKKKGRLRNNKSDASKGATHAGRSGPEKMVLSVYLVPREGGRIASAWEGLAIHPIFPRRAIPNIISESLNSSD